MKKLLLCCTLFCATASKGYSQFHENGYKFLRLDMTIAAAKKVIDFNLKDEEAVVRYDGIELTLRFDNGETLTEVASTSANAQLTGLRQNIMGKSYDEVKALLGDKLKSGSATKAGVYPTTYYYYRNKAAENEVWRECQIEFNANGLVERILAVSAG